MFSYIITTYTATHPPSIAGSRKVLDCWWRCVVQVHRTVCISRSNEPRVTVCRRLQRHTIATPAAVVVEEILLNMFLEKCQESTGTFWRGTTPPQIHITGISCLSTFIQCKSELHSPLHFLATTAQSTFLQVIVYHAPALARSCYKVMTPQHYR